VLVTPLNNYRLLHLTGQFIKENHLKQTSICWVRHVRTFPGGELLNAQVEPCHSWKWGKTTSHWDIFVGPVTWEKGGSSAAVFGDDLVGKESPDIFPGEQEINHCNK